MTVARRKAAHAQRGHTQRQGAEVNPRDALVLLTAHHNEIDKLAREFERERKTAEPAEKGKLALRICHAIEVNAAIKQEVFYPAAAAVLDGEDRELLDKAELEHDALRRLISKVQDTPADDPGFDLAVGLLAEQASRLMKNEEEELFPRLRHSRLDLAGTGERMAARGTELATTPMDRHEIRQARKVMGGRKEQPPPS
jgi:hypothetical protein